MQVLAALAVLRLLSSDVSPDLSCGMSPEASSSVKPCEAGTLLPSRPILLAAVMAPDLLPVNFDLIDYRAEQRDRPARHTDTTPHSMFGIKRHIGFAGGYDSGVVHGALGLYLTVAEWGRWNFGVPSPELGFGRYPAYDARRNRSITKEESTLFISLASVHYRVGYVRALGVNWYVNLEQIFDPRQNMAGSQFGLSFSSK
jgi:hypothetical protein